MMPQVAELNSETAGARPVLYMTIRYDAANGGPGAHRRFSTSSDQGITWAPMQDVSEAFPSFTRSILTEIYLCHACYGRN
jgi:hypothetical protein